MDLRVVELRQYTLKPGRTDDLVELFDREFLESQDACGMAVLGQFRDRDRPDRFVWLRGFADMETRRQALTAFYTGPVWKLHGPAANDTMIDSEDVLLLEPSVLQLPATRPQVEAPPTELTITVYAGRPPVVEGEPVALLHTLAFENTFPALPVRDADVTVRLDRGAAPEGPALDDRVQTIRCRSTGRSRLR
jgi:hypothetical protein